MPRRSRPRSGAVLRCRAELRRPRPARRRRARSRTARARSRRSGSDPRAPDHLATAQIVPGDRDAVGLGAAVTVEDESGAGQRTGWSARSRPIQAGWLSWRTPPPTRCGGARVGDSIELARAAREVEIGAIAYD